MQGLCFVLWTNVAMAQYSAESVARIVTGYVRALHAFVCMQMHMRAHTWMWIIDVYVSKG